MTFIYILGIALVAIGAYVAGRQRGMSFAVAGAGGGAARMHSLPSYHGFYLAVAAIAPMLLWLFAWQAIAPKVVEAQAIAALPSDLTPTDPLTYGARLREIMTLAQGGQVPDASDGLRAAGQTFAGWSMAADWSLLVVGFALALLGFFWASRQLSPAFRARNRVEKVVGVLLLACSAVAVLTTVGIVFSVLFETLRFFSKYPWYDFLFGLQWSPQTAIRADQVGASGSFGAVPLFAGTTLIMLIAMLVAGPIGLFSAIYMAEYASPRVRSIVKPVLEVLAGVPTVVFGFFAALTVAPLIRSTGEALGLNVASESALAAGLVMGVMIIPFVSSLSDDVINAVPQSLRDGSYGMGATKSETIKKVILPAALPGIVSAFMLAISRAVGETMIVVMAAGLAGNLTFNPLEAVTTVTVQIKTLLVGDQEFDSPKTLSAFALGFVLFFFTLVLNFIALRIVQKYREQYD
ncbi:phosphate transport system permease protein [Methylopila jiangsuensis]|uniref:Phosphate transport system permease protein n=1 Tax=Methylopila jiangsuensis TaxID=586230 RepID=A0A9W6JHI6_9HYPH|nr:phosphate ABC transporter permease subunit PstC [Methylopila jiangsuensis]MDR6285297.1 phosphate transport system permease protein [Methylopila jiangsuensis]GLK77312.1 phosphate transport system permease protein [Methylopila jiangsuensis]